jgi:4-diphosphocytidyl-2-C-methyl-D-erythritol kinase
MYLDFLFLHKKRMVYFAPAKINIGLYVTDKRSDGYHNIETVLYPIPLYDVIEIIEYSELSFEEFGFSSKSEWQNNLCIQAYNLLKTDFDLPPIKIHLLKNIPVQAGLGGGSSDAVAVLHVLNKMFDLHIENSTLKKYALSLGSDCPFFVEQQPSYACGRGELLEHLNISLKNKCIVVIMPPVGISTKEAFKNIYFTQNSELKKRILNDIRDWKLLIENSFQNIFYKQHFQYDFITKTFYKAGALYASMSGSGSAFYGIFENNTEINSMFPKDWFTFSVQLT